MEKELYDKIINVSNIINTCGRTGNGNYMISNKYLIEKIMGINKRTERLEKIKKIMKNEK